MKKFLVPTDFSDTSKNAAKFAAQVAAGVKDANIILYNVSDKIAAGSDGSLLTETDDDRAIVLGTALQNLKTEIQPFAGGTSIDCVLETGSSLVENMERYVRHYHIDMVIMGITGATRLEQIFMGSNTLNMVNTGLCPVLIVPPECTFRQIKNVVLASDLKEVATTTPVEPIKSVLDIFKPTLHIVNVDHEHYVAVTDEYKAEINVLEKMLADYKPEFFFIRQYDFLEAISQYALDKNIDLIIIVPKKNSFLGGLFKTSHTKKLAYHSHIPIVAIHE
ncbi:universal stress protein [Pseudoflavitalea sp. X16]|uniref:universal stress protein n=1 Tax=Paraflavitalea devenefica TaxID=2716334 RepID=UPI00141F14E7|nr:universal stress protein [Paraflavitalea devenefica]NII25786.1 universal stress protein [Paraflavitalea devenefica]